MAYPDDILLNYPTEIKRYVPEGSAPPPPPLPLPASVITFPVPNRVFQQDASGAGKFNVQWRGPATSVRLRRVSDNVQIVEQPGGIFASIPAGWYKAILVEGGVEGDSITIGVGDVYLVAGQSNGVSPLQPSTYVYPRPTAQGKVLVSDYYGQGTHAFIDGFDNISSANKANIAWISCGITLNRAYPVMFVNIAVGNTSTADWVNVHITRLFEAWAIYKPKAVLWHQGESDAGLGFAQSSSFTNMDAMVSSLRAVTLTKWVVALNSKLPQYAPIRAAQAQLIAKWQATTPKIVEQGPDTDTIRNAGEIEFIGDDLRQHGELWANRLIALGL
jgi:hypothetical protein